MLSLNAELGTGGEEKGVEWQGEQSLAPHPLVLTLSAVLELKTRAR